MRARPALVALALAIPTLRTFEGVTTTLVAGGDAQFMDLMMHTMGITTPEFIGAVVELTTVGAMMTGVVRVPVGAPEAVEEVPEAAVPVVQGTGKRREATLEVEETTTRAVGMLEPIRTSEGFTVDAMPLLGAMMLPTTLLKFDDTNENATLLCGTGGGVQRL